MNPSPPSSFDLRMVMAWAGALAAVVVVLLVWWRWKHQSTVGEVREEDRIDTVTGWPPQATRLLTGPERAAFGTLVRALPEYVVLAQVPLARFIDVPKRNSYAEWLRRVGNQSVDFLICDATSRVVAVVEVRMPPAQTSPRATKRQSRIDRTLKAARVPLHVWLEASLPPVELARDSILGLPRNEALATAPLVAPGAAPGMSPHLTAADLALAPDQPVPAAAVPRVPAPAINPFEESHRDSTQDEHIEAQEPPPTTWYDEFDSSPTPLTPDKRRPS